MSLQISSAHRQFLLDQAAAAGGLEVCGLLLGRGTMVERLVPARNVARDPARSFEIDPATLLSAHREARGAGLQVIGHWHSHPNGRTEPSRRDAARATDNGQIWLIIAGGEFSAWTMRAPATGRAGFTPVPLELA